MGNFIEETKIFHVKTSQNLQLQKEIIDTIFFLQAIINNV